MGESTVSGKLSLDRCTLLVFAPTLSVVECAEYEHNKRKIEKFKEFLECSLKNVLDLEFPQGYPTELYAFHYRTRNFEDCEGIDIQFGAKMPVRKRKIIGVNEAGEDEIVDEYHSPDYGLRIEFNPNKASLGVLNSLLKYFSSFLSPALIKVSRIDIAVDYEAKISPYFVFASVFRKFDLHGSSDGPETIYFGAKQSVFQIRVYNKKKELAERFKVEIPQSDYWRIELQCRAPFSLVETPHEQFCKVFKRLRLIYGGIKSNDWKLNLIMIASVSFGLQAILKDLPMTTRYRYQKFFQLMGFTGIEHPADIVEREFTKVFSLFRADVLRAFGFKVE